MTTTPELTLAADFPAATHDQWLALVDKVLKGASFERKLVSTTYDGIAIQPLYTAADVAATGELPGQANFTRGRLAGGAPDGAWAIRQSYRHPDAAVANAEILEDLDGGVNAVTVRLDVGGVGDSDGVVVADGTDLARLLDGVLLDLIEISVGAGAQFDSAARLLIGAWDAAAVSGDQRRGNLGADPLGALAESGSLPQGLDGALAQVVELSRLTLEWPHVRSIEVDTSVYVDAGASEGEELAAMVATGIAYVRALLDGGLTIEQAATRIGFTIAADADVFATIAKLRAARRLWAHAITAAGGSPAAAAAPFSALTATRMMSQRDPWVNMLRTTAACFAAGAGGADSVTVQPFDAVIGLPDALARRVARNTQLVLQEESHIASVTDPAGGSYFIEQLTNQLTDRAWARFQEIEAAGGMAAVLLDGSEAKVLATIRDQRMTNIGRRKDALTGVSEFPNLAEAPLERPVPDVDGLRSAAQARSTAEAPAGPATTIEPLVAVRLASEFEALRDASDALLISQGIRPQVFLANLGPVATHTARASFAKNFFESGGLEAVGTEGYADDDALVAAFTASGSPLAVICSSDKVYAERAAATAAALKAAGARRVYLAGAPGELKADLEAAGVDEFVHVGVDVLSAVRGALAVVASQREES